MEVIIIHFCVYIVKIQYFENLILSRATSTSQLARQTRVKEKFSSCA